MGIAICTQADLGTTPISSLPYVLTCMTPFSFGTTTFIINIIFILAQLLILKDEFNKKDYFQIIVSLFLGVFIDLGMYICSSFKADSYLSQIIMVVIGCAVLAFGITLEVVADIMYVPGEGIVRVISNKVGKKFGRIKVAFDIFQCIVAIFLSLLMLHSIKGLGVGTIISAFLVGLFVGLYYKFWLRLHRY